MTVFRLEPALPAHAYKTYSFTRPLRTHWRAATCDETACPAYLNGWVTRVDEATDLGRGQAAYIRRDRTRSHAETRAADGLTEFSFPAGQRCYRASEHRLPLERDPVFTVRGGDYRGNPMQVQTWVCRTADEWQDDFAGHQEMLADAIRKG